MKRPLLCAAAVLAFLLALPSVADAYVVFRPLSEAYIGDTSQWPAGLRDAVLRHKCVAGQEMVAPTWGSGMISAQLCFAGDEATINAFLKEYAQLKREGLILTLHPGKGAFRGALGNANVSAPFNWQLTVVTNGLFKRDGKATTTLGVDYYLGDRADLKNLVVPPDVRVHAGYDDKYRDAHKDNATVKAIDAFVRLRKRPERVE